MILYVLMMVSGLLYYHKHGKNNIGRILEFANKFGFVKLKNYNKYERRTATETP